MSEIVDASYEDYISSHSGNPADDVLYPPPSRRLLDAKVEAEVEPVSYRRFRKLINKPEDNQDYRKLATVDCKTEVEIKEYLKDKSIVVFTTESFVDEDNEYEVN